MHKRAVAAVTLLGLVVLATIGILVAQPERPVEPGPTPTPAPASTTLVVQVRDSTLLALGSVLMGIDGQRTRLDQLWWTSDWWIDQIGPQEVSGAELGRKPVPYVMQTLQDQTHVAVEHAWVMDRLAFAGLVDAVGGLRLDLPARTAYLDDQGLPQLLEPGMQTLTGAQAADFVLDPSVTDEGARLARFQAVWDQVTRRFPTDIDKARTLVVSLGALSKSTMTSEELSSFLTEVHRLRISGAVAQARVPLLAANTVRVRPPQGVRIAFALDPLRMSRRMGGVFQGYTTPLEPTARVASTAIRSEDIVALRDGLVARGWRTAWAGRTLVPASSATVAPGTPADRITQVEQALGVTVDEGPVAWGDARIDVAAPVGS